MKSLLKHSIILGALTAAALAAADDGKTQAMKADLLGKVDSMKTQTQVMVDQIFSFGELGFQEFETSKYLTNMLEHEGFHDGAQLCRHPDRVDRDLGLRQTGHRDRLGYRLHPASISETRSCLSRPA